MSKRNIYCLIYINVRKWLEKKGETIITPQAKLSDILQDISLKTFIELSSENFNCIITSESTSKKENIMKFPKFKNSKPVYVFSLEANDLSKYGNIFNIPFDWILMDPTTHFMSPKYEILSDTTEVAYMGANFSKLPKIKLNTIIPFWIGAKKGDIIAVKNDCVEGTIQSVEYRIVEQ
jgi:DNA-directed RNA polymerase subunit H (RpoH/RPB5)